MNTKPIGPFLGINNRLPDFGLRISTRQVQGNFLRAADNVDINNVGKLRTRDVELLVQAMTGAHSLYMTTATTGYLVRSNVMYAITLPTYTETLAKVLTSDARVSWASFNNDLYYSNGTDSGRITEGLFFPMGLPTPDIPAVTNIAGTLPNGTYQIAVSYYNSVTKEEGGISASNNPTLSVDGGFQVALPGATSGATHANVYISTLNGSIPMLAATVALGTATYDVAATPTTTRESNGRYEAPLPAGELFMSNGQLCSFKDKTVYVGLPFRPGYYLPVDGYIQFASNVTIAIENQGGTYIAADKTYFFPGSLSNVEDKVQDVLPYGAVKGTAFRLTQNSTVGWFGSKGVVIADTKGEVEAVMSDNIDLTPPSEGCSNVTETIGVRRVHSCGWTVNLEKLAVTTYSDYDFTSFSGGYGTKIDGLYALKGSAGVDATIDFGKQDFGTEALKRLPNVYVGTDCVDRLLLQVITPEHDASYEARGASDNLRMQRFDTGKGLRSTWFTLKVYNQSGSEFDLASVSFVPVATDRRI